MGADANFSMSDLADLLGNVFGGRIPGAGGGRRGPAQARGRDLETQARITFDQSIDGAEISLPVPSQDPCPDCRGSGGRAGSSHVTCPDCSGQGVVIQSDGLFSTQMPCPRCRGVGRVPKDPCPTCRGTGRRPGGSNLRVKIPAGIKDGGRIRVPGKASRAWAAARVATSTWWCTWRPRPSSSARATTWRSSSRSRSWRRCAGAEVRVPTLDGTKTLRVAPGTKHGAVLRLRGEGPPKPGGTRGDLHYRLAIELPKELTPEQSRLVDELAETITDDPRADLLRRAGSRTSGGSDE